MYPPGYPALSISIVLTAEAGTKRPKLLTPRAPVTSRRFLFGTLVAVILAIHLGAGHSITAGAIKDRIGFPDQIAAIDHDNALTVERGSARMASPRVGYSPMRTPATSKAK